MSGVSIRDRVFQIYWRWARGMTLGVRVVAEDEHGRIALVRHGYMPGWHLPGGGVEHGETAEDAALREFAEETGGAPAGPLQLVSVHANHARFPNDHVLLYRLPARARTPRPPDWEIAEVRWLKPDEAPHDTAAGTRRRLAEVFAGAPARADW